MIKNLSTFLSFLPSTLSSSRYRSEYVHIGGQISYSRDYARYFATLRLDHNVSISLCTRRQRLVVRRKELNGNEFIYDIYDSFLRSFSTLSHSLSISSFCVRRSRAEFLRYSLQMTAGNRAQKRSSPFFRTTINSGCSCLGNFISSSAGCI